MQNLSLYNSLIDWCSLDKAIIKSGVSEDTTPYIRLFLQDFNKKFSKNISLDEKCQSCIDGYINFYKKMCKETSDNNREVPLFRLMAGNTGEVFTLGKKYYASTFTDEDALYILENHPLGCTLLEDFFKKFPLVSSDSTKSVNAAKEELKRRISLSNAVDEVVRTGLKEEVKAKSIKKPSK